MNKNKSTISKGNQDLRIRCAKIIAEAKISTEITDMLFQTEMLLKYVEEGKLPYSRVKSLTLKEVIDKSYELLFEERNDTQNTTNNSNNNAKVTKSRFPFLRNCFLMLRNKKPTF